MSEPIPQSPCNCLVYGKQFPQSAQDSIMKAIGETDVPEMYKKVAKHLLDFTAKAFKAAPVLDFASVTRIENGVTEVAFQMLGGNGPMITLALIHGSNYPQAEYLGMFAQANFVGVYDDVTPENTTLLQNVPFSDFRSLIFNLMTFLSQPVEGDDSTYMHTNDILNEEIYMRRVFANETDTDVGFALVMYINIPTYGIIDKATYRDLDYRNQVYS